MKRGFFLFLVFLCITCQRNSEIVTPLQENIFVDVQNLEPRAPGEGHFEAWLGFANPFLSEPVHAISTDSTLVSIGKFIVDADHRLVGLDGEPFIPRLSNGRNLEYAVDAFISIEPQGDTDASADSLIIGGEFTGNVHVGIAKLSSSYREIEGSHSTATATVTIYR